MDIDEAYLWSEEFFDQYPDGPPGMTHNVRTGHRYIASIVPLHSDDCCRLCRDAYSGVAFYWSEDDVIAKV